MEKNLLLPRHYSLKIDVSQHEVSWCFHKNLSFLAASESTSAVTVMKTSQDIFCMCFDGKNCGKCLPYAPMQDFRFWPSTSIQYYAYGRLILLDSFLLLFERHVDFGNCHWFRCFTVRCLPSFHLPRFSVASSSQVFTQLQASRYIGTKIRRQRTPWGSVRRSRTGEARDWLATTLLAHVPVIDWNYYAKVNQRPMSGCCAAIDVLAWLPVPLRSWSD